MDTEVDNSGAVVWSVGHSTLSFEQFSHLIASSGINAIADVRSAPFSRRFPWFNHDELRSALQDLSIQYVFLGAELGGRPKSHALLRDGVANYKEMSRTAEFARGVERLKAGAKNYRIAMLCSEGDPLHCHRCLLVGRALQLSGIQTRHILASGLVENQLEAEQRLLKEERLDWSDLLWTRDRQLDEAYLRRAMRVAYAPGRKMQGSSNDYAGLDDRFHPNDG